MLIRQTCAKQGIGRDQLTIHADRGSSMTSKPVAFLLADLGVTQSHSRPHVSDDNPFSEAQFKTLKYRPDFPDRFASIEAARLHCQRFFAWYNDEHRHTGLGLHVPADVHYGTADGHPRQACRRPRPPRSTSTPRTVRPQATPATERCPPAPGSTHPTTPRRPLSKYRLNGASNRLTGSVSLSAFRASSSLLSKSWEDYYRDKLVDPVNYWRQNFKGRSLFRYIQSHPDMDHMGGLGSLFWVEKVVVENFWDTEHEKTHVESDFDNSPYNWIDWLAYKALRNGNHADDGTHKVHRKQRGQAGDFWTPDGLSVLSPTDDLADYANRTENWNNVSHVLRLDYGGRRVILPGDAEKPAWDSIEADHEAPDLSCDILKAAHHGRESGYSESAVDQMSPSIVVCSVGKKPSTDASNEYRDRHGAQVLSTRSSGTIVAQMWADGEVWVFNDKGERVAELPPL